MQHEKPESLMMSYGYRPEWSEGAVKSPIFQTSTFVFKSAEDGKHFFELALGKVKRQEGEQTGLIYSRINNPDMEILENRLSLWDDADGCAVFESGMAAIYTTFFEYLRPGDVLLYSNPLYGGTDHVIRHLLPEWGIETMPFKSGDCVSSIREQLKASGKGDRLAMVFIETPANPTNDLIDIACCRDMADEFGGDKKVMLVVDNTYMGPLWQHPLRHGADLVIYSCAKYIGGHSDVIAGACLGSHENMLRIKRARTYMGNMAAPFTTWLLMRSLETLKVRMDQQAINARFVAEFLRQHEIIEKVYYLGFEEDMSAEQRAIYKKQCLNPGAMVSFDVKGGEKEAFAFLNKLKIIKLAVSLGSTESLAQHPYSMTHAGVSDEDKAMYGLTDKMIRLSVGVEDYGDIIEDIRQALVLTEVVFSRE